VTARNFVARTLVNSVGAPAGKQRETRWLKWSVISQIGALMFLAVASSGRLAEVKRAA
jgi:hypothetical protein